MSITGEHYIGSERRKGKGEGFQAFSPVGQSFIEPVFYNGTEADVEAAAEAASKAFPAFQAVSGAERAKFLETIAEEIEALGSALVERAVQETGLPEARILGERGRTQNQLRLFARLLRDGHWVDARIDLSDPERVPAPKPDTRSMKIPLGPVVVFSASNFPLAFSVAGGDTASALAAGCPVIVKAHSAHPGTSELVAGAIARAAASCNMPEGVFSLLLGEGRKIGGPLVEHPLVRAVGFTGSYNAGMLLFRKASNRPDPIPFYGELGAVNPVFMLPGKLEKAAEDLAKGLTGSFTLGAGQFCTNPGLVVLQKGGAGDRFLAALADDVKVAPVGTMLTPQIKIAYDRAVDKLENCPGVKKLSSGKDSGDVCAGQPHVFVVEAGHFLKDREMSEEVFGSSTLIVLCDDRHQMETLAKKLPGQLTATLHMNEDDAEFARCLMDILEHVAGRVLFNSFPTGVEVCDSMVHGGPVPASTMPSSTSVGTAAIERFVRAVCYQDTPDSLLPEALKNENPLKILRLVNGEYTAASL